MYVSLHESVFDGLGIGFCSRFFLLMSTARRAVLVRCWFRGKTNERHLFFFFLLLFYQRFLFAGKISLSTSEPNPSQITHSLATVLSSVAPSQTTAKPRGAELARVLKVGDRVRRGPDWLSTLDLVSLLLLRPAPKRNLGVPLPFGINRMTV